MRIILSIIFLFGAIVVGQNNDSSAVNKDLIWSKLDAEKIMVIKTDSTTSAPSIQISIAQDQKDSTTTADTLKVDTLAQSTPINESTTTDTLEVDYASNNYDAESAIPYSNSAIVANCNILVKDRVRDFYELDLKDCDFDKKLATSGGSVMAIFDIQKFSFEGDSVVLKADKCIGEKMNLCNTERFFYQPSEALGTAFLYDSTNVLTASHCIKDLPWERIVLVTGYEYSYYFRNLNVKLHKSSLYKIKNVQLSQSNLDYVKIELDRNILDRSVPIYDTTDQNLYNKSIYTIGYPLGMPMKAISNGRVVKHFDVSHYMISIDAYRGNSGSPIFDIETGKIIGMLIGGDADTEKNGSCFTLKNCLVNSCDREVMIDIRRILNELDK